MGLPDDVSTVSDEEFRAAAKAWLAENLIGEYATLKGRGGPGDEEVGFDIRERWERVLGEAGWIGLGWPTEHGGRNATVGQQIIWAEEYARAEAPGRVNHMGENLLGPTLIAHGTPELCDRFLPGILDGTERWCQGYSEPDAGSDLANVKTRAVLDGDQWVDQRPEGLDLARPRLALVLRRRPHRPDLGPPQGPVVPARADGSARRRGAGHQPDHRRRRVQRGLLLRRHHRGRPRARRGGQGMGRGHGSARPSSAGSPRSPNRSASSASSTTSSPWPGSAAWPPTRCMRQRLVRAWIGLQLMKWNGLRSMGSGVPGPEASISKLFWGTWHRDLGELAMDVLGMESQIAEGFPYELTLDQKLFLFTRSETIYGGSNEIQRNVLGERVLGLPKEPNPT